MKIKLKVSQKEIDFKSILKKIIGFFGTRESCVVFFGLLLAIGYTGYLWYKYAQNYQWTDVKKQEYISTKNRANNFDSVKFEKVLEEINKREEAYGISMDDATDIFGLK